MGLNARAQWMEKFDYKDWSAQSNWQGEVTLFTLENNKLRTNSDSANSECYVARNIKLEPEMVWEFWVNLKFNTSSANYIDIYLFSDSMNLKGQKNGYFVRIGNTKDEIGLYKSKVGVAPTMLIDGRDNLTTSSNNILKVKVERGIIGQWILYSDLDATGNYFNEGSIEDTSFTNAQYFGLLVKQSTASFFKKHYVDEIYVGAPILDTLCPVLGRINVVTDSVLQLVFSEQVIMNDSSDSCFSIMGMSLRSSIVKKDTVLLTFNQNIKAYFPYFLTIRKLQDLNKNLFKDTMVTFVYSNPSTPQFKQLLITEIMADPDPVVNLPSAEYIEILNRHTYPIQLKGSTLSDPAKTLVLPDFVILPNEFVIICDNSDAAEFIDYGRVVGVAGMPSLNNTNDEIVLKSKTGEVIHKITYSDSWYKDETKKVGGWSLEIIDTSILCFEEGNWQASIDANGGTPGQLNSVNRTNRDTVAPAILSFTVAKEGKISLQLSETIDSAEAVNFLYYKSAGFEIASISYSANTITVLSANNFEMGPKYSLEIEGFKDCSGNKMKAEFFSFIIPDTAVMGDIIINEVLFNPKDDGVDYVELFNVSNKFIDLKELSLCNKDTGASFKNSKALANTSITMAPKTYLVITTSRNKVIEQFPVHDSTVFIQLPALPTLNNDKGDIWLITKYKNSIDGMMYDEQMHHGLLKDVDGVSLERISMGVSALYRSNWTSSSSNVFYGTPGLNNSQSTMGLDKLNDEVELSSRVISPDSDGYQDILLISMNARFSGRSLNMAVLDITGRKVRDLAQSVYLGAHDTFQWEGASDAGTRLPMGVYLIFIEIWGSESKSIQIKVPVTLGGTLNSY